MMLAIVDLLRQSLILAQFLSLLLLFAARIAARNNYLRNNNNLLLLLLLSALRFFMLHNPVKVTEHVRVCCLKSYVLLDFDLQIMVHGRV